jgi:hypothetical protein
MEEAQKKRRESTPTKGGLTMREVAQRQRQKGVKRLLTALTMGDREWKEIGS